MSNPEISVVICDDHALVRRGLQLLLANVPEITVVGEAKTGAEAIDLCQDLAPDVILLDLFLPDVSGVDAARAIKLQSPVTQIIMLTSHEGDEYLADAVQAGTLSYLIKESDPEDLIDAIKRASKGEAVLSPRLATALMTHLKKEREQPLHETLTAREMEVLRSIASGQSNQEIAAALGIAEKTVKSHVTNILSKLYLSDRTQAAVYAWRNQLVETETN